VHSGELPDVFAKTAKFCLEFQVSLGIPMAAAILTGANDSRIRQQFIYFASRNQLFFQH